MNVHPRPRRAFAARDLLALLVTAAIGAALALAAGRQMRQEAMTASSLSQLRWIAGATGSYGADSADRYWNFSWTRDTVPAGYPAAASDYIAQSYQAVDILRRRGRPDMPIISGWIPHPGYSHLTLIDYLDRDIPDVNFVAPGDANRLAWARDPAAFDAGAFLPLQPDPAPFNKRWPYSSSYEQPPAFYDQGTPPQRIYQGTAQSFYVIPPDVQLRAWRITDVAHPSQKAHLYDTAERDNAEAHFFLDHANNAAVPMAMTDGSVRTAAAADSNLGGHPNQPTSAQPLRFRYQPNPWDPQGTSTTLIFEGRYRWTRGGIAGRDFGGPEVDTGQP